VTNYSSCAFRLALGRRLRALRLAAGLTPAGLAAAAAVSPRTYLGWERGLHGPGLDRAELRADALACPIDALLGRRGADGLGRAPARASQPRRRRRALRRG
jgi:transcriptional regulator with XRE-family HTH domain